VAGRRPPLKVFVAISMSRRDPHERAIMWNPKVVHAFLLDSGTSSRLGGTGESFDWSASIPTVETIKGLGNVLLAGGLTPENAGEAIAVLKPWGVDVVSGVEARPGKKDPEKVRAFVKAVRVADKSAQAFRN
jgi:phosphoribosylanthranilate isomerase